MNRFYESLCKARQLTLNRHLYDSANQVQIMYLSPKTVIVMRSAIDQKTDGSRPKMTKSKRSFGKINTDFVRNWLESGELDNISDVVFVGMSYTRHALSIIKEVKFVTVFSVIDAFANALNHPRQAQITKLTTDHQRPSRKILQNDIVARIFGCRIGDQLLLNDEIYLVV